MITLVNPIPATIYIDLGFIGHGAEKLATLFEGYSESPNQYGRFLKFENYSYLVCNQGVTVSTNCFENEAQFLEYMNLKLMFAFLGK